MLAFAVLAVAVGAAMAVPQARTAILEFFRLRGATVERVETLPRVRRATENASTWGGRCPTRTDVKIPEVLIPAALAA